MSDQEKPYYYRAVPGSRELVTGSMEGEQVLRLIEEDRDKEGPAPLRRYKGEWLGGVRLEQGVMVPESVFDSLAPEQPPLEQAVYIHLFRISYGSGRNWCRVGKRELMHRARVSDRRLNVALDGLVRKGHVKPLNRNTKGTLYRVYLPSEVTGTEAEPGVVTGEREEVELAETRKPVKKGQARTRPLESPLNEERFADVSGRKPRGPGLAQMAKWFFREKGIKARPRDQQMAVTVLTELLEDGFSREEVWAALQWFLNNQPDEKTLARLPYFITRAIEESEESGEEVE